MAHTVKELTQGHLMLKSLMSSGYSYLNSPFIEEVDVEGLGLEDYYDIVKEPMWMEKMDEKFCEGIYESISDFVCDFRLMLLNCYRYNGVDSKVGKIAVKLETLFEQKLQILPFDIRQKTSVQATLDNSTVEEDIGDAGFSRRRQAGRVLGNDGRHSTPMLAVAEELEAHSSGMNGSEIESKTLDIVNRLRNWERKRHDQKMLDNWSDWWKDRVSDEEANVLTMSPELPDIFQFLCVARQTLLLDDLISGGTGLWFAELEAALVAPRGSQLLAAIITSLLSNARERASLSKKPLPSYARWNHSLQKRLNYWYQVLHDRAKNDPTAVLRKIGVEEIFFKVFGYKSNLMRRKHFHELSIYQRIIALKSLIDYVVWTQDTVRACLDDTDWNALRPIVLGNHGGSCYIRFPCFDPSGALRIYKQQIVSWPDDTPKEMINCSGTFGYIPAGEPYSDRGDNVTTFSFIVPPVGGKPNRKPIWMKQKGKMLRTGRDVTSLLTNRLATDKKTRRSKRKTIPRNGSSKTNLSTFSENLTNSPYTSQTPSEVGTYDGEETDSLMETDDNTMDCTLPQDGKDDKAAGVMSLQEIKAETGSEFNEMIIDAEKVKRENLCDEIDPEVRECLNDLLDSVCAEIQVAEEQIVQEEEEEEIPEINKPRDNDFQLVAQELPQLSELLTELQSELEVLQEAVEKQSRPNRRRAAKRVSDVTSEFDSSLEELRQLVSSLAALKSEMEEREPLRSDEMKLIKLRIRKQDESYEKSKVKQRDDKILETAGDESPPEDNDDAEENSRAARLARRLQKIEEDKFVSCKPVHREEENQESNNSMRENSSSTRIGSPHSSSSHRRSRRPRRPNMAYYQDSDMESQQESASEDSGEYSVHPRGDEEDYRPPGYSDRKRSPPAKRSRSSYFDEPGRMSRLTHERRDATASTASTKIVNGNCYMAIPRLSSKPQPTVIARSLAPFMNTNTAVQYSNQNNSQQAQIIVQPTIRLGYSPQNLRVQTVIGQQQIPHQQRSDIPVALVRPLLQQQQPNSNTVHSSLISRSNQIVQNPAQSAANQIVQNPAQSAANQIIQIPVQSAANQIIRNPVQSAVQSTTNHIQQFASQSISNQLPVSASIPLTVRTTQHGPVTTTPNNGHKTASVTITNHISPNSFPVIAQSSSSTSPAKKVFRVFENFFTEDLQPVSLNGEAGTMTYLPRESVPSQRYELARRMISMYKLRQQQGQQPGNASSSQIFTTNDSTGNS